MVTHIVLFRVKEPVAQSAEAFRDKLLSMQGRVASLQSIEVGFDESHEERSSHVALTTTHKDWQAFEDYQRDAYHQEVIAFAKNLVVSSTAVDYTT